MRVKWELDEENGINPIDPVGDISIADESGNQISVTQTYLDSWFSALLSGFKDALIGKFGRVEIYEESHPLLFEPTENGLRLTHGSQSIVIDTPSVALAQLHASVREFLNKLKDSPEALKNTLLSEIEQLIG